ncbi:MAG TPA: ATP-binding protein [Anaeromyxobacteraceae bacterium]|nr:ATP-binding protein [Anaeromyxobacteraceae bacterium]
MARAAPPASRPSEAPALPATLARATVDSLVDPVVVVAADGAVLHLNPSAEEFFGRSRDRAAGRPLRALPGGDLLAATSERVRASLEPVLSEMPSPSDPDAVIQVDASPLLDGGTCAGAVLLLRRPRAGEQALDFETLAAGLAHEIRNPLAGLQGSAELLAREAEEGTREYAQVIAREAKRVDGLVRELLDLSRPARLHPGPVNIHDVLRDVIVLARGIPGASRVAFTERYDPSLPPVLGDSEKLTQVVLNVVRNALDAVADATDKHVILETGVASVRVRAEGGRTRPLARVSIVDSGPGIPLSMLSRIFTPFATSKPQGTGLGLPICQRIVHAHGGRMEVKNRPGAGAEVVLYLPLDVP